MDPSIHEPKSQLAGRLTEALAEDPRTNMLEVQVTITGGKVFLLGTVPSPELCKAAEDVVRELVEPGTPVVNDLAVSKISETESSERIH